MIYYTIVKVLTYIACSLLLVFLGINFYKTQKASNKIVAAAFILMLLMRMLQIR